MGLWSRDKGVGCGNCSRRYANAYVSMLSVAGGEGEVGPSAKVNA